MKDSGALVVLLIFGCAIVAMVASAAWHFSRGRSLLEQWADENGYTILSADYCHVLKGPFFFRSGKGNAVYRVEVRDKSGEHRRGYVRCGGLFAGMWSDRVTAEWD